MMGSVLLYDSGLIYVLMMINHGLGLVVRWWLPSLLRHILHAKHYEVVIHPCENL